MSLTNFNLHTTENYNKYLDEENNNIYISKYIELIHRFLLHSSDNIFIQNTTYHKFVIQRGIETVRNIYNMLLLYTKNLDLVHHHVQKAFCYYVEFIGQIGDEHHSFLQLNSKDATLFVYKKSIFDINQDYRKKMVLTNDEKTVLMSIHDITYKFNECIMHIIINNDDLIDNGNINNLILFTISNITKTMAYLFENSSNLEQLKERMDIFNICIHTLYEKSISYTNIFNILNIVFKKYNSNIHSIHQMSNKIQGDEFSNFVNLTPLRIANYILI
jgi:hypothetical protein